MQSVGHTASPLVLPAAPGREPEDSQQDHALLPRDSQGHFLAAVRPHHHLQRIFPIIVALIMPDLLHAKGKRQTPRLKPALLLTAEASASHLASSCLGFLSSKMRTVTAIKPSCHCAVNEFLFKRCLGSTWVGCVNVPQGGGDPSVLPCDNVPAMAVAAAQSGLSWLDLFPLSIEN